ncbi:META domain-containing protein [Salinimonas chungwhensis]|uniref:META domain-containing protein n=1 Tax=Salinimonas chungwhensis TaxID=265425 RepID=UPI0003AA4B78
MYFRLLPLIIFMTFIGACTSIPSRTVSLSGTWEVASINKHSLSDNSSIMMTFEKNHVVTGFAGCNNFRGLYHQAANTLAFENIVTTRKACRPTISKQETAFLQLLADARFFEQDSDGQLFILDSKGRQILSLAAQSLASANEKEASGHLYTMVCGNEKAIHFQLAGTEHLSLTIDNDDYLLARIPSASGAKYSYGTITLWNKGQNTITENNSSRQQCQIQ